MFVELLAELNGGKAIEELDALLRKIVIAAKNTGKQGVLKLEIKVNPDGDNRIRISDSVTAKEPMANRREHHFWTDDEGDLSRDNPNQRNMFDRDREERGE